MIKLTINEGITLYWDFILCRYIPVYIIWIMSNIMRPELHDKEAYLRQFPHIHADSII